jgi:hypothetical protein
MTVRRLKTYAGSQGYVYQYYFVGMRPSPSSGATEYVFDVTSDRKTTFAVSIFFPSQVLNQWIQSHRRTLTDAEQYAAVKLRLFRAFDEIEDLQITGRPLQIDSEQLEQSLASLGVE